MDEKTLLEIFKNRCHQNNLKITPQRTIIYKELMFSNDHPTAEKIYKKVKKKLPHISFDTVYRTVLTFSEIGLVNIIEGRGEPKRFDPNLHNHHHFRCLNCSKIIDFNNESYDQIKIPKEIQNQYKVTQKKVILTGLCDICK